MDDLLNSRGVLAQLLSEGVMRHPSCRLACRYLGHHLVDLLKRQSLGLGHKEVGENDADGAGGAPEEEHLGSQVGFLLSNKVRRDDSDDAVPVSLISLRCEVRERGKLTRTS